MNRTGNSSLVVTTLLLSCLACGTAGYVSGSKESGRQLEARLQEVERLAQLRQEENLRAMRYVGRVREQLVETNPELADELHKANRLIQLHPDMIIQLRDSGAIE